jgi:tRNA nucleotidyltransferase (CCA-adding enzyme)
LVVGGFVRDEILGRPSKDLDVEVFGLGARDLEEVLSRFGEVLSFGASFGVMQVRGIEADFSLPPGDPANPAGGVELAFADAARRRDLTMNAMARDPLSGELLDPWGGRADIAARVLRATDAGRFPEDPVRGLRVAQFAARFAMEPDAELRALCAALDLSGLPGDRLRTEFDKLLLQAARPGAGLELLRTTGMLRFVPELLALIGVPQDPHWHPEGDVWIHTVMTIDAAADLRDGRDDAALMYGALCHDLGKPGSTEEIDGRIRSFDHDNAGLDPTRRFLRRLNVSNQLETRVLGLVAHHLAPAALHRSGATARAYRRLARRLASHGVTPALLERVARADHWGRTTVDARERRFDAGDAFLAAFSELSLPDSGPADVVLGRHLVDRGFAPGPAFTRILEACRAVQDETGGSDPEAILDRALASTLRDPDAGE